MKALELFESLRKGILLQFEAAGVYNECLFALNDNRQIVQDHIRKLIDEPVVSGLTVFEQFYKESDFEYLGKTEKIKYLGQQIIFSVYTALEIYFIKKFKEYITFKLSNVNEDLLKLIIGKISNRSIEEIKENYSAYLNIHLPFFDIEKIFTQNNCTFQPKDAWEAIIIISKSRNEIAHSGISNTYKIKSLLDCWYPYEFVNYYVILFDANFDDYIYNKRESRLINAYKARINKSI